MTTTHVLKGMSTVSYFATNFDEAKEWYTEFLGVSPYFNVPGYAEFRIGDYQQELGIIDRKFAPSGYSCNISGAILYWHVDNLQVTLDKLIGMGAVLFQPVTDHSHGKGEFVTASVTDPFGNILGIMFNKHYMDILNAKQSATYGN